MPLPTRRGPRPKIDVNAPHYQLDQHTPPDIRRKLIARIFSLSDVVEGPSRISGPRSRALLMHRHVCAGPREAFMIDNEFANLRPPEDGAVHVMLPMDTVREAVDKGWGEVHPATEMGFAPENLVILYGPRNEDEIETVYTLVAASHAYAMGKVLELV